MLQTMSAHLARSETDLDQLKRCAVRLSAHGKGILAADESIRTIGKRLESYGLTNDAETRRRLREMLVTSVQPIGDWLSGMILFEETLSQFVRVGNGLIDEPKTFSAYLESRQILPGIKVDTGLQPLENSERETHTTGLDGLSERCQRAYNNGARFAKWRAAIRIDEMAGLPTEDAISVNAKELAEYAKICLSCRLVPIVEPEILVDGSHNAAVAARVARRVIPAVYRALEELKVPIEATLLKPMMITPGVKCSEDVRKIDGDPDVVARNTLDVMRDVVPELVPGIMFLSGGMTEEEATVCLDRINKMAGGNKPWNLSFSFGRALQTSALLTWGGQDENRGRASEMAAKLAHANSQACRGVFAGKHPSIVQSDTLYENFRGWQGKGPPA